MTDKVNDLVENKVIREQYINRTEVLDKVKKLLMIPAMEVMTMAQVAQYYEVDINTIKLCYQRNSKEINLDGVIRKTPKDFKNFFNGTTCTFKKIKQERGKLIVNIDDLTTLVIPNRGTRCYSKRAVLRFGMLLRDSEVAKEVRRSPHIREVRIEIINRYPNKLKYYIDCMYNATNLLEIKSGIGHITE